MQNTNQNSDIIIYQTKDGESKIEVNLKEETVWLNQRQMSHLFDKDVRTINEHIKNIYKEKELTTDSTIRKFRIVQNEGNREIKREVEFYNLDVIISVGYRVKSLRGIIGIVDNKQNISHVETNSAFVITKNETMPRATARVAPTVGIIIGQYKSLCVIEWLKYIKENNLDNLGKFWQRNYYEHIIRNETELKRIRQYIIDNPKNWLADRNCCL